MILVQYFVQDFSLRLKMTLFYEIILKYYYLFNILNKLLHVRHLRRF